MAINLNFLGTGGIIEGNLGAANVNVNLDKSLMFDGTNDFIDCGTDTDHDFNDHFTLACWAKNDNATTTDSDREHLIAKYEGSNGKRIFRLYVLNSTLHFGVGYNSGDNAIEITHSMTGLIEHWNHYAASFDGGVMKLYVNGVLVTNTDHGPSGTNTLSAIHTNNAIELEIGAYQSGNHTWTGQIADVRIYNAVVDQPDIQLLASKINTNSSLGAGTTNLKGYWKLNNETASGGGSGTGFVVDESGTVNQGTLTNFSGTYWDYDAYSVDVYDNSTTTDGTFTVTQGKVECKALTSLAFDGANDNVDCASPSSLDNTFSGTASWGFWIRPDSDGQNNFGRVVEKTQWEIYLEDESSGKTRITLNVNRGTTAGRWRSERIVEIDKWNHLLWVYDGSSTSNDPVLYLNGVAQTLTESSTPNGSITSDASANLRIGNRTELDRTFDGDIKDVRYYDYLLSAEQAASLYSNTYSQTPNHHWKFDDSIQGTATTTAADSGTETAANGSLDSYTTTTGNAGGGGGSGWQNGTLDLDGALTIAANGTLSAPRGDLQTSDTIDFNGTFTHNNGTWVPDNTATKEMSCGDKVFYNVKTEATGQIRYVEGYTIENEHSKTSGNNFNYIKNTGTYLYGTTSSAATLSVNLRCLLGSDDASIFATVKGVSSLYPVVFSLWDDLPHNRNVQTGNMKVTNTVSNIMKTGDTCKFIGDMEFTNDVTVDSGDTLDLNGQRVEFGGVLSGSGALNANNSTLIFTATSGTVFDGGEGPDLSVTDSTDCTFICDAGSGSQVWKNRFQSSDATIFVKSGTLSLSYWNWEDITNLFVGGTFNNSSANRNVTTDNLTIPTGGTLSAGSGTLTCAGDFTTSGGLIGKSAMVVSGDNDYEGMVVTELQAKGDWGFSGNQGLTIEGWFKFDDLDFGTGNDAILVGHVRSGDTTGKRYGCGLQIMDDKVMAIAANNDTAHTHYDNCSFPVSDLTAGKWHHLAMTVDDANLSSTPLTKLYLDGKLKAQVTGVTTVYFGYNWVVGGYADNHDSQGWTNRRMDGAIARCSAFRQEMTEAQIRSIMFTTYDEMAALTNGVDEARTVGWWQFDEGQGTTVDNKGTAGAPPSSDHSNFDGTIAAAGTTWAEAGTFNPNTSNVIMAKSGTQTIAYTHLDNDFSNLTINAGSTTQMLSMGESGNNALQDINRNFTVNGIFKSHPDTTGARVRLRNPAYTFSVDSSVKATALADLGTLKFDGNGTFNLPEFTTKIIQPTSSGTILALTGPLTVTEELDVATGTTINTKGHNLTTKVVDLVSGGTFNIEKNSSLIFSDVSGCGFGSSAGTLNCKGSAAASFDGNDDKMEDTSNPLPASGPFTFTMFFRTSTTGIRQGLVDFTASTARGMLDVMTDNKLLLYLGGSNYRYWDPITSYLDGEWHHIAVYVPGYAQADVNNITVHIDGNLINPSATVDTGAAQQPTMADLKLGCGYSSGNAWDGDLADARIFEKALTADNLTTLRSIKPNKANATSYSDASNVIGATHWWKLNESNFPSDDAADSVGSIALSVTGAVSNRITVTSATGGTPSNYWDNDTGMDVTAHYTTFDKSSGSFYTSSSTIDIDNCTYSNHDAGATVYFNDTGTITSFTNNTISCNSVSKGLLSTKAHAAFDNITITNSADYDVKVTGERIEFTNSNFDITKVELGDSSSHLISSVHNDTENLYEICAGSGGLTYSAISNKPDIPNGVLRQRTGLFLFNSDNKEFNTLNVFSGATIRVSDTKDMYLTVFDNDGTWDQSTSGYTTGEIHVGDFTPFDSGDIIDETDFVDTGFHDTTHYLEMDL